MTVSTIISKSGPYAGAGTTGPFLVDFRFLENSHLQVIKTSAGGVDAPIALDADYTVTGAGSDSGLVTLWVGLLEGEKLTIVRDVPATQEADYVQNDAFPAESHEEALDKLTMLVQQLAEQNSRSIKVGISDPTPADEYRDNLLQRALDAETAAGAALASENAAAASEQAAGESAASIDPQALSSDYAGPDEPPVIWPLMTWADTGNMLFKRRNEANSVWVVEATLLKASLPQYAEADIPTTNMGDIHVIGKGTYSWGVSAYAPANVTVSSLESIGAIKAAASNNPNEVVVQSQAFGVGQTWQNLTASRAMGTTYVNSSAKPIEVVVRILSNTGNLLSHYFGVTLVSGGVVVSSNTAVSGGAGYVVEARSTILPGASYVADLSTNISAALQSWAELR